MSLNLFFYSYSNLAYVDVYTAKKAYIRLKSSFTPLPFFVPTNLDGMERKSVEMWLNGD